MKQIRRLFIETDVLHMDELDSAQIKVSIILDDKGLSYPESVFDETKDFAWHELDAAWESVKRCDEIYGDSSLVLLCGFGSYTGAPVIMNEMMKKAIEEKIEGKSVIFLRPMSDIEWGQIDRKLLLKAFKKNNLYTLEYDDKYLLAKVDIKKLLKETRILK